MAVRELQAEGIVLATALSGERHLRLHLLSPAEGRIVALWRRSQKTGGSGPDLFDQAAFHLESSSGSGAWFVKDYRLGNRRLGLAKSYQGLKLATRLAELLWRNLHHAQFYEPATVLINEALDAFESSPRVQVVYLKSLYRFASEEGYAVRQQWAAQLPQRERERARAIIHQPLRELDESAETEAAPLIEKLERWLRGDTDIIVP